MRVLHAISGITRANGGPPIVLHGLARAQVRAGLEVRIVATWRGDPAPEVAAELEAAGVRVTQIGPARNPMSRHRDTPRVLDELVGRADVVHVHAVWEQIQHLACRAARRRGVPYVFTPHGMLDPWNMSNGYWKKRLYLLWRMRRDLNQAAALHFATETERDVVARLGLRPMTIVEPFGLDAAEFAELPARGEFRARYPQVGGRKLVVFLGRLDFGKGLELLIPAFARVAAEDAALVIVGPDSHSGYRRTVERMIAEHRLGDRVVLTGMLSGREKLAALVDAYVLAQPSFHENFGLAVVEGMACGCPVMVSDQVYLWRSILSAGVGWVVSADGESVAGELGRTLADDAERDRRAAKARPYALSTYDWDVVARRWVRHYETVRSGSTPAPNAPDPRAGSQT